MKQQTMVCGPQLRTTCMIRRQKMPSGIKGQPNVSMFHVSQDGEHVDTRGNFDDALAAAELRLGIAPTNFTTQYDLSTPRERRAANFTKRNAVHAETPQQHRERERRRVTK